MPGPEEESRSEPWGEPLPLPRRRGSPAWVHVGLFLGTIVTTILAGALLDADLLTLDWKAFRQVVASPAHLASGFRYSLSVLAILLAHEMGHYLACRRYGIDASLPYFIPGVPILGTFGAFIRIRDRIPGRRALFDVGVAGPLAGFVVAIPVFLYGMSQSRILPAAAAGQPSIYLGFPALFTLAVPFFFPGIPDGAVLSLSPYLSAAWVGMLATSLNLLPAGQLDGGHICYALSRRFHARMSRLTLIGVILMGAVHKAWIVWAVILLILGDRHPPLLDEGEDLGPVRRLLAAVALVILLLSFMPSPVQIPS